MNANLTEEQEEIFQFARNGHNILITGQAGTGKSWVVNCIRDDCKQRGRKVVLICSRFPFFLWRVILVAASRL